MKTIIITLIPIISFILGVIIISIYSNNSIARNLIISSFSNLLNNLPLNFRLLGYDPSDVEKYWQTLRQQDQSALDSEQKALKIDLLFPLLYGSTTIVSSLYLWYQSNPLFSWLFAIVPMIITAIADWIENTTTLKQLEKFRAGDSLEASKIKIASLATQVKLVCFVLAYLILFYLAIK